VTALNVNLSLIKGHPTLSAGWVFPPRGLGFENHPSIHYIQVYKPASKVSQQRLPLWMPQRD